MILDGRRLWFRRIRRISVQPALAMLLLLLFAGCAMPLRSTDGQANAEPAATNEPVALLVFAAASLTNAFAEIADAFETQNPNVTVIANYSGSSGLATQLLEGGIADVFASANSTQIQHVVDAGRIVEAPQIFATNRLVVIVPAHNPAGIETLSDLANRDLKLVLAVTGVPVRDYTDDMIAALAADPTYGADYADAVYANLVSEEENVRQVTAKVALGEADAGVVYSSDVTPDIAGDVAQIEVPDAYNVVAVYPIARLADALQAETAQHFVDFVLSGEGQKILNKWGFGPAPQ